MVAGRPANSGDAAGRQPQHHGSHVGAVGTSRACTGSGKHAIKARVADPAVHHVCRALGASAKQQTQHYTLGALVFGGLLFACGAAAWSLPWLFVAFAAICLPWRVVSFVRQKWVFFLVDFCYFVNLLAVIYLLWLPNNSAAEALVYALSDGPLAGALVAWQCPWVFNSAEHTTSVLMHLLPGLAVFAHRHHTPLGLRGWRGLRDSLVQLARGQRPALGPVPPPAQPQHLGLWLVGAPLLFYVCWQLLYFVIVQVMFRSFILRHNYETSYSCLARRAAKTNNFWNRLVRRGTIGRRICMYGAVQLVFTLTCCTVFLPTYFSYELALALQALKIVFPVYFGARYVCEKVPQHVFLAGMRHLEVAKQQSAANEASEAAQDAAAAAVPVSPRTGHSKGGRSGLTLRSCAAEVTATHQQPEAGMPTPLVA